MTENLVVHPAAEGLRLGASYHSRWDPKRITMLDSTIVTKLPQPPSSSSILRQRIVSSISWGMMLNDELGDCTIAGKWHKVQSDSTFERRPFVQTDPFVRQEYLTLTGGVDSGLALLDVLRPWQADTGPHGLAAYAEVPWTDQRLSAAQSRRMLKLAIHLGGGSYIAVDLPTGLQRNPYDWTKVGTGADWRPGSWGGHCVVLLVYVSNSGKLTFFAVTWGRLVKVSELFLRRFMPEAWLPISRLDWQNTAGNTPTGRPVAEIVRLAKLIAA